MATVTMFALTEPEARGQNFFFYGISDALQLHEVYIMSVNDIPANTLRKKVRKSKYMIFQHVSLNQKDETNYMRLTTDKSKIFQTGTRFDIPKEMLDNFYNPKKCTIPEALASPKKRRLSVEGTIVQVYPIKEGQNWKRRDVIIEDPPTTKKICCKLWNTYADSIKDDDNGSTVILKNMEVDIYNERHQLRTTTLSSLTITTPKNMGKFQITGVDYEDNNLTLITTCGRTLEMNESLLSELDMSPADFIDITPLVVNVELNMNTVTKIHQEQ